MSTKINKLLQALPSGSVATQKWLATQGVNARLADKYVRGGWLQRIGRGAYARAGQSVDWPGALSALQRERAVYPGGPSAIELRGYSHYLPLGRPRALTLFGPPQSRLPSWFRQGSWSREIRYFTPRLFTAAPAPNEQVVQDGLSVTVASLERAALEVMWMVPKKLPFEEARQLMEALTILRPNVVQAHLVTCRSVKAKRLLLHCAERLELPWFAKLRVDNVDLGSGPRTIHPGGRLDSTYDLVVNDSEMM